MTKLALPTVLAALLVLSTACGGEDDAGAEPQAAVADFMEAVVDRDSGAACARLTPGGQKKTVDVLGELAKARGDQCSEVLDVLLKLPNADEALAEAADLPDQIRSGEVEDGSVEVDVSGDEATVTMTSGQATGSVPLRKIGDQWLVDDPTNIFLGVGNASQA